MKQAEAKVIEAEAATAEAEAMTEAAREQLETAEGAATEADEARLEAEVGAEEAVAKATEAAEAVAAALVEAEREKNSRLSMTREQVEEQMSTMDAFMRRYVGQTLRHSVSHRASFGTI